jgi:4a-hydroxytetrahydrobiopterin dehydratase
MRHRLDDDEILRRLARLPGWELAGHAIRREYRFPDFKSALAFANTVGAKAEARDHHPDLLVQWGRVTLTLSTHDAGGLTALDFDLAAEIDA